MSTVVFEIPLTGGSDYHRESLAALEQIIHESPERLILKMLGPGGLAPEAVLCYHDILSAERRSFEIVTVSYSNLIGADFLLFLLGSSRDIRPSAWCHVSSSPIWAFAHLQNDRSASTSAIASDGRGGSFGIDWMHLFWDYEKCLEAIGSYVALNEVIDRRLDVAELKELLLVDCWDVDSLLLQQLSRREKTAGGVVRKLPKSKRDRPNGRGRSI